MLPGDRVTMEVSHNNNAVTVLATVVVDPGDGNVGFEFDEPSPFKLGDTINIISVRPIDEN